jgi:hypothetical protein
MLSVRQLDRSLLQKSLAVVFALAMVAIGFVQAVHVHDDLTRQTTPPSHCSLCVAAHHAVAVVTSGSVPALLQETAVVTPPEAQRESSVQIGASFIRPPPQVL